jgi:hypothetical protein
MEQRHLGRTGVSVSQLCLGAMMFGDWGTTDHDGDGEQGAKTEKGGPYGGAWQGPQFVFTRDGPGSAAPGFTFVGGT